MSKTLFHFAGSLTQAQKRFITFALDLSLIPVSLVFAAWILLGAAALTMPQTSLLATLAVLMPVGGLLILVLGLHKTKLNAYHVQGVVETALVATSLTGAGVGLGLGLPHLALPMAAYVMTGMVFLILAVSARLVMRRVLLSIYRQGATRLPILIYGAGQTGQQLAAALSVDDTVEPVAFIDEDRRIQGLTIAGLRVYPANKLQHLINRFEIKRVVLAMPQLKPADQSAITMRIAETGCEVHALPSFADLITKSRVAPSDVKPVDINELLGRARLEDDLPGVSETYQGRNILVTGAGGSIGSELCRQLIKWKPKSLILFDHSELALFDIHRELQKLDTDTQIVPVLGSVVESELVRIALRKYQVNIVLHAAAYKHVPLVEENALEGIRNNVFGTKAVAEASRAEGVERFILVSTDKAVRPSSIMGASKRFAEMVVQDLATRSTTTRFSMVRFGNVMGSSGSVIPLFQEQIARGGPVTLTDMDVTRFFMTIPEAVSLVLLAGSFARGGDVFVLDMGEPVLIRDLAEKMIENAGYSVRDDTNPNGDIAIQVTGLRPGEKLHEELLIGSDMLTTPHAKILRAQEAHLSEIEMANALQSLWQAIDTRSPDLLQKTLRKWIEKQSGLIGEAWQTVNE
ncbi:polysaccharide biosynthesis protein [Roseovarius phycicola]|uniref:Nucleoside-diphosphate sugar epimerase/dehydratase n=1 Tax=Roseovarius phycicola TaxID=3080976 RepID=A0ABZ2HC86_9RHOB